jgi:DMSO/TMAO reductase YedYZ molybdopterin-dependent catalytic subunit
MGCTRRAFMRNVSVGTLGLGFGVSVFPAVYQYAEARTQTQMHDLHMKGTIDFKGFIAKEVTPNDEFYITSYSAKVPEISLDKFRLRIEGLVENPYALTFQEIEAMRDRQEYVTLECIGNPVGGNAISNALWEGVTLRKILEKASPKSGIVKAAFFAAEGYTDSIPYELALSEEVFVAFRMNREPLPPNHGYPLRLVVPGIFGMKNVKWLSKIELVNYDFKGYWEKDGWSDEAVIPLMSEVLMPMDGKNIPLGHYVVGGIAFGGRHGVSRVQVSIDGRDWQDVELKPPLSKWAWTLWRYDWTPTRERDFSIRVRAFDRSGKEQESPSLLGRALGSYPDGARGIETIHVTVRKP